MKEAEQTLWASQMPHTATQKLWLRTKCWRTWQKHMFVPLRLWKQNAASCKRPCNPRAPSEVVAVKPACTFTGILTTINCLTTNTYKRKVVDHDCLHAITVTERFKQCERLQDRCSGKLSTILLTIIFTWPFTQCGYLCVRFVDYKGCWRCMPKRHDCCKFLRRVNSS